MAAGYFDHNATTPLDSRVRASMLPWLGERFGNAASIHAFGRQAREAVENARCEVAELLGAGPAEIVFAASGTEANNTVLRSCAREWEMSGHLVVSAVEHPSVEKVAADLAERGMEVSWVAPDGQGRIDVERMTAALQPDTRLVCLLLANNVVGTLQPVAEVAAACRERGVPVLSDAVQAVGKVEVNVEQLGVDYLTLGAHKFYGPLGSAALWCRREAVLWPWLLGGSQERRRRAGTVDVPAVVGLGTAARLAALELEERREHMEALRQRFERGLEAIGEVTLHGYQAARLPNTSHVAFAGVDSQALLIRLDLRGFAVSAGAACSSGAVEPSSTMMAMGVSRAEALSALRFSFGVGNTEAEVDSLLEALVCEVAELRRLAGASP